jgi:hypothetical protein
MDNTNDSLAKRDAARRTALEIARGMLHGNISLIEGCRSLVRLRFDAEITASEALKVFVGVESETDHYPVGNVRSVYAPELLARLDADVSEHLSQVRPVLIKACREIICKIEALQLQSCNTNIQ